MDHRAHHGTDRCLYHSADRVAYKELEVRSEPKIRLEIQPFTFERDGRREIIAVTALL